MVNHYYSPIGRCIYCDSVTTPGSNERLGNEHIIPLSMGGNLILREASCNKCAEIINSEIENPIMREEWGYLRSKLNFPTRKIRNRKTDIELVDINGRPFRIPLADYSCPVFVYKFSTAGYLSKLAGESNNQGWTAEILTDENSEIEMQTKYPSWNKQHTLKARPHEFARLIAKIGYGYSVAELGLGTFDPFVKEIIIGRSDDYFNFVGGSWNVAPPIQGGDHITNIRFKFIDIKTALVIVDIRLLSQISTPGYHVVVGKIDLENDQHAKAFRQHHKMGKLSFN